MNKLIIIGALLALSVTVIAIGSLGTTATDVDETSPVQCQGDCGNPSCAAADGGACDCSVCPAQSCVGGGCEGACTSPTCGAKVGRSCGCSR